MESTSGNAGATDLLECVVKDTGPEPDCSIVWLHGLGADGNDFAPIVPQLKCAQNRPVRFIFPHAPVRPVTVNGGMRMRAWYDIRGFEIARDQDATGIRDSVNRVEMLLARELDRGVQASRLLLAGFSQGGAIALRCGLGLESALAGMIGLSCYLLEAATLSDWSTSSGRATPVMMGHGTQDPVVPVALGREAVRTLNAAGVAVDWKEWPMQHAVCPEEIALLDRWIDARLA